MRSEALEGLDCEDTWFEEGYNAEITLYRDYYADIYTGSS
jgi:hypothetical protein